MTPPEEKPVYPWFVLFLLALLPSGNAVVGCKVDEDTWWHLRVGQYLVEHWSVPHADPFSQLGIQEGTPWAAYSWLYELLLYTGFRIGGIAGIITLRHLFTLFSFVTVAWVLLRHVRNQWAGVGVMTAVTLAMIPFTTERPWHFTIAFTAITLHAILEIRSGRPAMRFIWLPLLYILWANIHIQFILGLGLLGMAWLVGLGERMNGKNMRYKPHAFLLLAVGCAIATLVNPYGLGIYRVIWEYATQTQALGLVSELQPPDFLDWWNWPLLVLLLIAAYVVSRRRWPLWDVALLGTALFFSLRMQRDLWYGVLAAGAVILHPSGSDEPQEEEPFPLRSLLIVSIAALVVIRGAWEAGLSKGKTIAATNAASYPVEAVKVIQKELREGHIHGPLLNNFDWGGYLIWNLPELPVSIDGRTNFYGEQRLQHSFDLWGGKVAGWEEDPEIMAAGVIIAPQDQKDKAFPLRKLLQARPDRWKILYEDKTAVVFVPVE